VSDPTLRLPFDQYQRYRLVTDILESLRSPGERLSVLDVGGRTALLRRFMGADQVFLVDLEASEEEGLVLGTGSCLPFKDGSVDAVVTFDTLEHVPPHARPAFLSECLRVARRWGVQAGPYDTEGVARGEELLTRFLRDKLQLEHRYLAEHAAHGLPDLEETEAALGAGGARVLSIGHANLHRWLALMCAELYMDHDQALRGLAADYYEFYNGSMYASDHAPPVYRHALVAALGDAPLPDPARVLGPGAAAAAPGAPFEPAAHVLGELMRFDIQRDVVQKEWARLEEVHAGFLQDLEGHRQSLATLKAERAERAEELDRLNARANQLLCREEELLGELEGIGAELERHRTELEWHRAELLRERKAGQETADLLRDNLAQAAATEQALRGRVGELDAHRATLETLLGEANVQLGEKQSALDHVRAELSHRRQTEEALRAALRDRWGNLLRAFGLR